MLNAIVPASLKDVYESNEVAVDVGVRVLERISDPSLGSKINDPLGSFGLEEAVDSWAVGKVHSNKTEPGFGSQANQSSLLQIYVVVIIKVVKTQNFVSSIQESVG